MSWVRDRAVSVSLLMSFVFALVTQFVVGLLEYNDTSS
jgi:hypothetical protein